MLQLTTWAQSDKTSSDIQLANGKFIRVQACSDKIVRIRISENKEFKEPLMERYGIVKKDWTPVNLTSKTEGDNQIAECSGYRVVVDKKTGAISVSDAKQNPITTIKGYTTGTETVCSNLRQSLQDFFKTDKFGTGIIGETNYTGQQTDRKEMVATNQSSVLELSLNDGERFYGGGSSSRTHIQHRGTAMRMWSTYQQSEAPMPFVVSSRGWGIFNNNTSKNYFDIGRFEKDKFYIYNNSSDLDVYLMLGESMVDVVQLYTIITGKPYLLPKWAYGLSFGSNIIEDQFNSLDNANRFRQEQIPCDIYWLEGQWMSTNYDFSMKKDWNENKYQVNYSWLPDIKDAKRSNLYINRMKDLGYKTALWLCIEHDLSIAEEDRLAAKEGKTQSGQEHWFSHLTRFVDQGVVGFKLDPGRTILEHPDRKYHNGKTDAEMHNLNQVLLQKEMYATYREHAGTRSFHHYCGGYAGSQHWGAATVGDNGGNSKTLYDLLNHSFSGNCNMAVDMLEDVAIKGPGIHYTFLTPWVQLNSWAWMLHPWYYNQHDKDLFRSYAQLRYSLIPYIYSTALEASVTGRPIVRPMAMAFPDDRNLDSTLNEYMFGENLLVGAYTNVFYLPAGNWIDCWSGKKYTGKQTITYDIPKDRAGALFIRSGAIIPQQKPMQYIGEQPLDTLIVKVYPEGKSSYTLLEDDGISFDFEKGAIAKTEFTCNATNNAIEFVIAPVTGNYKDMPKNRSYALEIASAKKPRHVSINGKRTSQWAFAPEGKVLLTVAETDPAKQITVTIK